MNTQTTYPAKPTLVSVIAWTTLASGIVNLGWGLVASATALLTIVGICCTPLTILPTILGIFEIIYAAKLLGSPPQPVRPATNIAVLEIVCILTGNVFSMMVGIISLVFYNDQVVKEYFARLNGDLPPEPVPPAPEIPPVVPGTPPAPVEEPIPSPITGEEPAPLEAAAPGPEPTDQTVIASRMEAPAAEPEPPSPTDQTVIASVRRDGVPAPEPEPPTDEPDSSRKASEE